MAPARNCTLEYSSEELKGEESGDFDEAWLHDLYTSSSSSCPEDTEDRKIMEEEEAYMLEDDEDESRLPPEAEKILYDYYSEQRQNARASFAKAPTSTRELSEPSMMMELEFDMDQSRWGIIDISPVDTSAFFVTSAPFAHSTSSRKEGPDLTPQVLAAISAATKPTHRIITIAEIDQSDYSDEPDDTLSLWSQLLTDLEDDEDANDESGVDEEEESEDETSEGCSSDEKGMEDDEWCRYKRIPINAFYKSRKGRRQSITRQTVIPQNALRSRGESVYLTAPKNANKNNVLLRYSGVDDGDVRKEVEEDGLYWKSTLMDIY